jgi:hypothetical protein
MPKSLKILKLNVRWPAGLDTAESLQEFWFANSNVAVLPAVPDCIQLLHLYDCNQLTALPRLPEHLERLSISSCAALKGRKRSTNCT